MPTPLMHGPNRIAGTRIRVRQPHLLVFLLRELFLERGRFCV